MTNECLETKVDQQQKHLENLENLENRFSTFPGRLEEKLF